MNEYVYRISPANAYLEDLNRTLKPLTYLTQEKAVNALRNACEKNGWKLNPEPETTEDNCLVFKNAKDGVEIARIMREQAAKWREQGQAI